MATGGISAAARLHAALSKPLYQRCPEIRKLLEDTGTKELHAVLPTLLESIFGFGSQPGWGIGRISKSNSYDFTAIRQLLHPAGPLLRLIYRLMTEPLRYEFPLSCLPFPVQKLIEDGSMPLLFADSVQLNPNGRPYNMLSLNAFEYYFYHFSYFLVNPQSHKSTAWTNPTEALFTVVLEEYLNYFLPPDGRAVPAVPLSAGTIKSPIMHQSPRPSPSMGGRSTPLQSHSLQHSLLRSPAPRTASPYSTPLGSPVVPGVIEPGEQQTWRSQTLLQIMVEFWLHQTSLELDKCAFMAPSTQGSFANWGYHTSLVDPYRYMLMESLLPSGDHVRVVRMLVKHLHYFVNSAHSDVILSPYSPHVTNPWDDFKRAIFPQIVRKKLYGFLKHSFERWPLDASFRLILETWLSYLQPWRYTDPAQSNREKDHDIKDRTVEEKWRPFLLENLLFYSVLFNCFLQRIHRTELSAPKNAYILFRVTKVFSIPNLRDMIENAECALYETVHQMSAPMSPIHDMGASYLAPASRRHGNIAGVLTNQISELEGPGYRYIPMFCEATISLVEHLLQLATQAKETAVATAEANKTSSGSFLAFLGFGSEDFNASRYHGNDGYEDMSGGDMRKVDMHLTQSTANLCHIFQLDPPDKPEKGVKWGIMSSPGTSPSKNVPPDVDQTEEGPQLGPLARYQLMNGLRKFEVEYQGDPDLQPIRSFESAWLVRVLHHVAKYFNTRYEQELTTLYHREDFTGRLAQVFLTPPTVVRSPEKLRAMSPTAQIREHTYRRPRLSLRWLATYHMVALLLMAYTILYFMLATGPVAFMILVAMVMFVYASLKAMSLPKIKQS